MNGYLEGSFYRFHVLEKQKLIKTNGQTEQLMFADLSQVKVKFYEKRQN